VTHARDPGRVADLAAAMADGSLTAEALVYRCLDRIAAVDGEVQAWITMLTDASLAAARRLDAERKAGRVRSPLHGIPVAIKDIIDVAGLQTRAWSRTRDHVPPATLDATLVAHLRAAGAIILGKVHTTEYAYFQAAPPTRNPHDLTRTPGGSSGGSAAAVAAGMVPLAVGSQTAGSVNRPAAFCGIGAFKPSTLSMAGTGFVPLAPSFDTPGGFGGKARDAVALMAAFAPDHLGLSDPPRDVMPSVVVLEDPHVAGRIEPGTAAAIESFAGRLNASGLRVRRAASPVAWADILAAHRTVLIYEMARLHGHHRRDLMAPRLGADMDEGLTVSDQVYAEALATLSAARQRFWSAFTKTDLLLTAAAPHVAPADGTTGDPSFVIPVTALGGPAATVLAGHDAGTGMPVGAMLYARPGRDAWLAGFLCSPRAVALDI
jgi:aspartyl-tRNA(Asn)/glutamyl-tRNA(Gln) amidotransferase subunit A